MWCEIDQMSWFDIWLVPGEVMWCYPKTGISTQAGSWVSSSHYVSVSFRTGKDDIYVCLFVLYRYRLCFLWLTPFAFMKNAFHIEPMFFFLKHLNVDEILFWKNENHRKKALLNVRVSFNLT